MNRFVAIIFLLLGCRPTAESDPQTHRRQPNSPSADAPVVSPPPMETDRAPEKLTPPEVVSKGQVSQTAIAEPEPPVALVLPTENVVFSFKTKKGKTMNIVIDKEQRYMVYRYGTKDNVELQFPPVRENTFSQFTYQYYWRGGGPENEGVDLNRLVFTGASNKFTVYSEQHYENGKEVNEVGIRVTNLKTGKETDLPARIRTVKGSLLDLRPGWDLGGLVKVEGIWP